VDQDDATIVKNVEDSMNKSTITLYSNDPMGKR